jgi:hypothetical protein
MTAQARRAREQATAYNSVFAPTPLKLDDGETVLIPPHPNLGMLDDEQQEAYEELLFETESYDREDDLHIPEQTLASGVVLPAEIRRGVLKQPYRKDGVLIKPPYSVRVAQVCLGEADYKKLRAGGKSAADVRRIWSEQSLELAEREADDPKSVGGSGAVEDVSGGDSG